jgi:hypothetical protein
MSDWEERVKAAEESAERLQAAEEMAEERFKAVQARTDDAEALDSEEFRQWMETRRATDAAWGAWSIVMDAKPAA